jgi:hypothetical protein
MGLVLLPILAAVGVLVLVGPVPQDLAYHAFADQREVAGIPHFGDVITNVAFVIVGLLGLALRPAPDYAVFFLGVLLTGAGSAYYHVEPTNASLVWDRAPMTMAFMGLAAALIRERVSEVWGRRLLLPLVSFGLWSVWYWARTDDLRPYILAQYAPLWAVLSILLLFPGPSRAFWLAGLAYAGAKVAELLDRPIYEATGFVTGHNLKHVLAALGTAAIVVMLTRRRTAASGR